jgi:hypothetical protein
MEEECMRMVADEDIWTQEGWRYRRLEKITFLGAS